MVEKDGVRGPDSNVYTIGKKDDKNIVYLYWYDSDGVNNADYREKDMRTFFIIGAPPENPRWQFRFKDEEMNKSYNIPNIFDK